MDNLAGVVEQLNKERDQAAKTMQRLDAALAALSGTSGRKTGGGNRLSAAARAKIAAAQRSRWAKLRGQNGQTAQGPNVVRMPKKTISPSARKKIAAAQKARWAKIKAAQKKIA